jgi:hypothetical protein
MDRMALILGRDVAGIGQQGLNVALPRDRAPRASAGHTPQLALGIPPCRCSLRHLVSATEMHEQQTNCALVRDGCGGQPPPQRPRPRLRSGQQRGNKMKDPGSRRFESAGVSAIPQTIPCGVTAHPISFPQKWRNWVNTRPNAGRIALILRRSAGRKSRSGEGREIVIRAPLRRCRPSYFALG